MRVGIHQPHYLPWLRYFEKVARSDLFIILDDVQYEKNGYQNRNRIKTAQGPLTLTVPVLKPLMRPIGEIGIDEASGWRERHRRAIVQSYSRAPHFARYWPELEPFYLRAWDRLGELNREMLAVFLRLLEIPTCVRISSELGVAAASSHRLAALCRAVGGTEYLSGSFAVGAYLDPATLRGAGIGLALQEWRAPEYSQLYPAAGFAADLSILDLLFNEGPRSRDILLAAGGVSGGAT